MIHLVALVASPGALDGTSLRGCLVRAVWGSTPTSISWGAGSPHRNSPCRIPTRGSDVAPATHHHGFPQRLGRHMGEPCFFWGRRGGRRRSAASQSRVAPNTANQFRKRRETSTRLAPRNSASRLRQRRGEGHSARCGQHARPPALPHQGDEELHVRGHLPSFGEREHPDGLDGFLAPSSSCLDGQHDQFAPSRRCILGARCLLVVPCPRKVCSVHNGRLRMCFSVAGQWAAQSDVHRQLCPLKQGRSWANTSILLESCAETLMFMSRRKTFCLTQAPASGKMRATVRSVGVALFLRRAAGARRTVAAQCSKEPSTPHTRTLSFATATEASPE